jgi:signal transduction histidine kinase
MTFKGKLRVAFFTFIATSFSISILTAWNMVQWERDSNRVVHTQTAIIEINGVLFNLAKGSTAKGDDNSELRVTREHLANLRQLTSENPILQQRIDWIDQNIPAVTTPIETPAKKGLPVKSRAAGLRIVSALLGEIAQTENGLLEIRARKQQQSALKAKLCVGLGGAVGLLVGLLALGRVESTLYERDLAQSDLAQLRENSTILENQNTEILRATQMKSAFLANMSHELRTPLNSIIGFTEVLIDGIPGSINETQNEYLGDILECSRHLLQLINDVLDLAKVESGKLTFHPEAVDLDQGIRQIVQVLTSMAAKKRIEILTEIDTAGRYAFLDLARFKQVLFNYLSNAIKFAPENARVTVRMIAEAEQWFRLEVEDTGFGISEEDHAHLFKDFQQLDTGASKRFQGTGLGLVLTKRIVEAQGGRVGVKSELSKGSTFFAILPRDLRKAFAV